MLDLSKILEAVLLVGVSFAIFVYGLLLFFVISVMKTGDYKKPLLDYWRDKEWRKGVIPMALIFWLFMLLASLVMNEREVTLIAGLAIIGIAALLFFSRPKRASRIGD